VQELATSDDDKAYFEAVEEDRAHLSQFGETTAKYYKTLQDVRERRMIISNKIRLGIWDSESFKGTVNAQPNEDKSEVEVGYWLRASAVGNGYATLAVKALTDHLTPRFDRVFAEVHMENEPSIKVMRRAGYAEVGRVDRDWGNAIIFEPVK
jgi:RimJ/RimL family protein N-acetyltransferase